MDQLSSMMGALFYRRVSLAEIKDLDFKEMKYWYKWHETYAEQESKLYAAMTGG